MCRLRALSSQLARPTNTSRDLSLYRRAATLARREGKEHPMNRAEEASLAWALADSTTEFLNPNTRAWLCAKIGAGEKATAIGDLLACYARSNAELPHELAGRVQAWIRGYAGTE